MSEPAGTRPSPTEVYGGPWRRLGARIIDAVIVWTPLAVLFAVIPGLTVDGAVFSVLVPIVYFGYFVSFETSSGATPGKRMLDLVVTGPSGSAPITAEASAKRNWWTLVAVLGAVPALEILAALAVVGIEIAIGVTISADERHQGFHDQMAGTLVAHAG